MKSTAQLKDVFERTQRDAILAGAFAVDSDQTKGERLLVFDDLHRSGATAGADHKTAAQRRCGGGLSVNLDADAKKTMTASSLADRGRCHD